MPLRVTVERHAASKCVVVLEGRLDSTTYFYLEEQLSPVLAHPVSVLVFELSKLDYVSSMGLRVLLKARKAVEGQRGTVMIANPQPQITKVLEIAAALPKQNIFASIEEADRYFDLMQKKALSTEQED